MQIFDGRMAFVPEGQADRSLARSAWVNAAPKGPSRKVRCDSRGFARRFDDWSEKFQIRRLKTFTLDVGLAAPDHSVPYGTVLSRTLSQALRAWLLSCCPSGTNTFSSRGFD